MSTIYNPHADLTDRRLAPGLGHAAGWRCATCSKNKSSNQQLGRRKSRLGGFDCAECVAKREVKVAA